MSINYVKYEFQSHEKLVRLRMCLPKDSLLPQAEDWRSQISAEEEDMQNHRFRVAVVGEFNRGKSTFLNALLGQQILPADILPATATINRIVYGSVPRAFLLYKDGTKEEVAVENLSAYITKRTQESTAYASKVAEAVVEYPSIFCQNHVDLIDTPGMNDEEKMENLTIAQLGKVDLAIMVVSATIPFSESEAWFMEKLLESEGICQIIVVVTGMDRLYDEEDRAKILALLRSRIPELVAAQLKKDEYDRACPIWQKYDRIFSHLTIFGVSSTDALRGLAENDNVRYQESGIPELTKQLPSLILTSQNDSAILRPLGLVRRIIREYQAAVPAFREQMRLTHVHMRGERNAFAEEVYAYARQMAEQIEKRMFDLIDGYICLSDAARREYIACLASIRRISTAEIRRALEVKTADLLQRYNEIRVESLEPELDRLAGETWCENCGDAIQEIRARIQMAGFLNEKSKAEMDENLVKFQAEEYSMDRIRKIPFAWTHTPVAAYAFMDVALIEYVQKGVRDSFWDYRMAQRKQIVRIVNLAADDFSDVLEQIVVQAFQLSNQQMAEDDEMQIRMEDAGVMRRFQKLEEDTNMLEKEFNEILRINQDV